MKMPNLEALLLKHKVRLQDDHFVLKEFQHATDYVNKAVASPNSYVLSEICCQMVNPFRDDHRVGAVIAPAVAGIPFMTKGCDLLNLFQNRDEDSAILGLYADKVGSTFVLDRGYAGLIKGLGFIAMEDVVTSGDSLKKAIAAGVAAGGTFLGASSMWDRRGNTAETLGFPLYYPAVSRVLPEYTEADCPKCRAGVPVNLEVGRGRAFVAWKKHQEGIETLIRLLETQPQDRRTEEPAREHLTLAKEFKYDNHPRLKRLAELYPLAA